MMKRNYSNGKNTIYATIMTISIAIPFDIKIKFSISYTSCSKSINIYKYQWGWRKWYKQTFVTHFNEFKRKKHSWKNKKSPRRGIEPRSPAWQAGILTTILSRIDTYWFEIREIHFHRDGIACMFYLYKTDKKHLMIYDHWVLY